MLGSLDIILYVNAFNYAPWSIGIHKINMG